MCNILKYVDFLCIDFITTVEKKCFVLLTKLFSFAGIQPMVIIQYALTADIVNCRYRRSTFCAYLGLPKKAKGMYRKRSYKTTTSSLELVADYNYSVKPLSNSYIFPFEKFSFVFFYQYNCHKE